jgi:hypothetical protein
MKEEARGFIKFIKFVKLVFHACLLLADLFSNRYFA